jgi:ATP phosphoribosyltransferase
LITLALPKGRLAEESIQLLLDKKWLLDRPNEKSKELTYLDPLGKLRILLVRAQDVPTYVEGAAADAGIVGYDVIREGGFDLVYPQELNIGKCRLSLAANKGFDLKNYYRKLRVATKYPSLTREFFFSKGISCEIIKLYGSIELAPIYGLSDCIVDIVESGETLRANGLVEVEVIMNSSARFVIGRGSLYTKRKDMIQLLNDINQY